MKFKIVFIGIVLAVFSACKPNDPKPGLGGNNSEFKDITLKFNSVFENQALSWATQYKTQAGDTVQFEKIKFILSNFTFEKSNGSFITLPETYAYLTLKDGRDSVVLKNIPKGSYKSIRFQVGLDSSLNHSDPTVWALDQPLSPALNDMHWGWAGGYIFNVIEGYYQDHGVNTGFSFHIALVKNARVHSFVQDFEVNNNIRMVFEMKADKYFSNIINYSLKNDGSFSHSGAVDPVMDKFIQNMSGIFELISVK